MIGQQGVSRSCAMCIGFIMHLQHKEYDEVYQYVRERRGICRPNVGFMCQVYHLIPLSIIIHTTPIPFARHLSYYHHYRSVYV